MIYAIADVPHEDYDNYDTLNKLFHALSPHGWVHSSWMGGLCPSLRKEERHGNVCRVYVDYINPDLQVFIPVTFDSREDPGWGLLSYRCYDAEGMLTFHEEFDNVDKLIIYLTKTINIREE